MAQLLEPRPWPGLVKVASPPAANRKVGFARRQESLQFQAAYFRALSYL